jgi:hypothetical protein
MISDSITDLVVIATSDSDEAIHSVRVARWIASWSLSSGARSRDPLASNTIQPDPIML